MSEISPISLFILAEIWQEESPDKRHQPITQSILRSYMEMMIHLWKMKMENNFSDVQEIIEYYFL